MDRPMAKYGIQNGDIDMHGDSVEIYLFLRVD
jgi:hypothetical protein